MTRDQVLARLDAIRAAVEARRQAAKRVRKRPRARQTVKVAIVINGRVRRLAWDRFACEYRDVVRRALNGACVIATLEPVHAVNCRRHVIDDGVGVCRCGAEQMLRDVVKLPARPNRKRRGRPDA